MLGLIHTGTYPTHTPRYIHRGFRGTPPVIGYPTTHLDLIQGSVSLRTGDFYAPGPVLQQDQIRQSP